jgi:hypothetical protein
MTDRIIRDIRFYELRPERDTQHILKGQGNGLSRKYGDQFVDTSQINNQKYDDTYFLRDNYYTTYFFN